MDSDSFRSKVMQNASLMSFKKHETFLKDVFVIYAAMDQTDDNLAHSMFGFYSC